MNAPVNPGLRVLTLKVPALNGGAPRMLELLETQDMTLLDAIKQVRGSLPPTRLDSFVCHAGACNTCSLLINGKPGVPCSTFTRNLGQEISIAPGEHAEGWGDMRDDSRRVHG